jgi:hypothetical protein
VAGEAEEMLQEGLWKTAFVVKNHVIAASVIDQ